MEVKHGNSLALFFFPEFLSLDLNYRLKSATPGEGREQCASNWRRGSHPQGEQSLIWGQIQHRCVDGAVFANGSAPGKPRLCAELLGGAEIPPDQSWPFGRAAAVLPCCLPFPTAARNQLHCSPAHTEGLGHARACRNTSRNKAEIFLNTVSSSATAWPFFSCYGHTAALGLALPPSPALLSSPCPSASGWVWPTAQQQPGTSSGWRSRC